MLESLAAAVGATAFYDWVGITGSAARFTSFDYAYLPMTKSRIVSIVLLAASLAYFFATIDPARPRIAPLLLAAGAAAVHCWVAIKDMFRQRAIALRTGDTDPDTF